MNHSAIRRGLLAAWILGNLLLAVLPFNFEIPTVFLVLFGGLRFLVRNVPRMTVDIPAVALGGAASVAFALLAHWLLQSFTLQRPDARPWKFRWTIAVMGTVILMFTAGVSFVGLAHQSLWLAGSSQPIYEEVLGAWRYQESSGTSLRHLKEIAFGFVEFENIYNELPGAPNEKHSPQSWATLILPFLHYYPEHLVRDQAWDSQKNRQVFTKPVAEFLNPNFARATWFNEDGYATSHFAANERVIGPHGVASRGQITDGWSQTILVGEVNTSFQPWGKPENWRDPARGLNQSPNGFGGVAGSGVVYFVMADGSVRALNKTIDPNVLRALATPNDGDSSQ